eukprot:3541197-Prymnesium_polylepis.1
MAARARGVSAGPPNKSEKGKGIRKAPNANLKKKNNCTGLVGFRPSGDPGDVSGHNGDGSPST